MVPTEHVVMEVSLKNVDLNTPQSMLRLQKSLRDAGIDCYFEKDLLELPEKFGGQWYHLRVRPDEVCGLNEMLLSRKDIQYQLLEKA